MFRKRPPKVKASSAFLDTQGKFKCAGPLSALPFNPHPYDRCPPFRVSFNHHWHTVELTGGVADTYGWVAQGTPPWDDPSLDATPRVELRSPR
jgi:hypothetical protein